MGSGSSERRRAGTGGWDPVRVGVSGVSWLEQMEVPSGSGGQQGCSGLPHGASAPVQAVLGAL